jgi:hypothetical protein
MYAKGVNDTKNLWHLLSSYWSREMVRMDVGRSGPGVQGPTFRDVRSGPAFRPRCSGPGV